MELLVKEPDVLVQRIIRISYIAILKAGC